MRSQYRTFGRTGLQVSPLGFGGAPIGLLATTADEVSRLLNALLDDGVNVIDTAACYYGSEALIGRSIAHRRDSFVLISKCGHERNGKASAADFSPKVIRNNIDRSLARLGTDHIDVMLLHSCDLATLEAGEALGAVVEARDAGKVRFCGYSGDNETAAYAAGLHEIDVLQCSLSICDQANIETVLPTAQANHVGVMAKRPLANAAWKSIDDQYDQYRGYARPYHDRFAQMGLSLEALGIDGEPSRRWPGIALRFVLSLPGVDTAIIGTTRVDHVSANLEAASRGPLPEPIGQEIRRAARAADPAGAWRGLT